MTESTLLPIFPLSNVVLYPRIQTPLLLFEPRYRALARDVLAGERRIGMVTVRPERLAEMPGDGIIYWEVGTGSWNDGSSTPSEDITRRHKDGAVVSRFGGSAIWLTYDEYYDEEQRRPGQLWCNHSSGPWRRRS